MAKIYYLLI